MLSIHRLHKTYPGGVKALDGVSLDIPPGVFGLLGPNGAGKSTLMKIAATLLAPDAGSLALGDINLLAQPRAGRRLLGYLPQNFGFYPSLTADQNLDYLARLKGVTHASDRAAMCTALLERVNLSAARDRRVGEFSGGMVQRLGIAQALIGRPKLLIVDEPTAGLDPEERNRFHNLLAEIAEENTVVILSTHIVSDVAGVCQRLAIIRRGQIVAACTPREATAQMEGTVWEAWLSRERAQSIIAQLPTLSSQVFDGGVRVRAHSPHERPTPEFTLAAPTLEDFYLARVRDGGLVH